jgi:exonuclease SbcC
MKIEQVELKNIGPHSKLEVSMSSGLVGIIGANGAGKSTLINSVYAALTNDFSRFGGTKADVVKNDCGKEHSYIRVTGSHRGQEFELTRWLKPNKNKLVIGNTELTKANEVNEAIQDELNIPKSVIDKYVFVNQWDMFSFLSQTASERAKTFQFLCGTDSATTIQKACRDFVARHKSTEVVDNSVELHETLEKQQDAVDDCVAKLTAERAKMAYPEDLEEAKAVLAKKDKCDVALTQVVQKQEEVEKVRSRIKADKAEYLELKQSRTFLLDKLKEAKQHQLYPLYDRYSVLKTLCEDIKDIKKRLKQLAEEKKAARDAVAELSEEDSDRIEELDTRRDELLALKGLQAHFADFSKANFTRGEECPTCKQLVDKHHIEQICSEISERGQEILKLQADFEELEALRERHESATEEYASAVDAHAKTKEQLAWHKDKLPEGFKTSDLAELGKLKQHTLKILLELKEYSKDRILGVKTLVVERRSRVKNLVKDIAKLQRTVDEMPSSEAVMAADDFVDDWNEAKTAAARYSGSLESLKAARDSTLAMLHSLQGRLKKHAAAQKLVHVVSECEDLFHWSGLPKSVSQSNMELLVEDINENLSLFDNPFSVQSSEDLTFLAYFPGKPPVKANQLSGGQKVVLAIAFRAALDRVFGHDVGMMFLDEPTAGLDTDNIDYFHTALQQFSAKLSGKRQIAVITHVQELESVFDQVVTVNKD